MAKIRVRARTVEMLGRQQIAGIPTALSELFKNAHDAYARNVIVDFYRADRLLVLRDDGLGMCREEFEDRWLTLGTESKLVEDSTVVPPPVDEGQKTRPILGEKGIGRLAVATLGPRLLLLTRAKSLPGKQRSRKLVAAFLNWDVFDIPGADLDEIEIPLIEVDRGGLPTAENVKELVERSIKNLRQVASHLPENRIAALESDLRGFEIDPVNCYSFLPSGPSLTGPEGHGTHFLIQPVEPSLDEDLEPKDDRSASPLTKMLIGFSNTMGTLYKPPIRAEFRDHSNEGVVEERIGPSEFFQPNDFKLADHRFTGEFNKHGQFIGEVRIYDESPVKYVSSWEAGATREAKCGPFKVDIAYVQGVQSESRIPPLDYARIAQKISRIGGLYIYRDGIRVLPYGDSDVDFLDIEKRRSKGAAHYFFSYRRMFGAISISRKDNLALVEKAGREGFRQNSAFRDFKSILETFFVQLAADFFHGSGELGEAWSRTKAQLTRKEQLRREREKEAKALRSQLAARLAEFEKDCESGQPAIDAERLRNEIAQLIDKLTTRGKLRRDDAVAIRARIAKRVEELRSLYRISRPRGVGLPKDLEMRWESYLDESNSLDRRIFEPLYHDLDSNLASKLVTDVGEDPREEIISIAIRAEAESVTQQISEAVHETKNELEELHSRVTTTVVHLQEDAQHAITAFREGILNRLSHGGITDTELWTTWEHDVLTPVREHLNYLDSLAAEIRAVALPGMPSSIEVREALDEELVELQDSQLAQFELLQLGLAIGIIQHEFRGCVKGLRSSLSTLKRWADANPKLQKVFQEIRTNFDHLDGYLSLFTPLTRRLYRKKVDISGAEIATFVRNLFGDRFVRHQIEFTTTKSFDTLMWHEFPSSIYPCFVNLVDNAIYWISSRSKNRSIRLDLVNGDILVEDSGPGIKARDVERVFDLGFTRKPGGRGMGLHISRETLKGIGYELSVDSPVKGKGACFRIHRKDDT
jgi:signal transduction histidine kinase